MKGIEVKNVSKNFGSTLALDHVSLVFEPNKIYGLLGRNGAGKSTLLNVITNCIFPDSGHVELDGIPLAENDKLLGKIYIMSENNNYPESMKVSDVFKWSKEFYKGFDTAYALNLCEQFSLDPKKKLKQLSTGYTSIFKVIVALCVDAPYVFLDEPILGLDAHHRVLFYRLLLASYSDNPRTFVISTHLIEEISGIIEEVVIIKNGKLIRNESCDSLLKEGYTVSGSISAVDSFIADKEVMGADVLGGLKSAYILGKFDKSALPSGIELTKLDLQNLFIQLTNI